MEAFSQLLDVTIRRIDKALPLPTYATAGSVGFDLLCREDTEIAPRKLGLVPGNVIVQTPPGYMLLVTLRSSTPRRKGLLIPHELPVTASQGEIKRSYRQLARRYHPDLNPEALDRHIKLLNQAYKVLSNPVTRAAYDEQCRLLREEVAQRRQQQEKAKPAAVGGKTQTQNDMGRGHLWLCARIKERAPRLTLTCFSR